MNQYQLINTTSNMAVLQIQYFIKIMQDDLMLQLCEGD